MSNPPKHHLLVVDDEDGPRQSIRMVFRNEYSIHLAEDGEQAIAIASRIPIDIAILDIRMAGMSGIAVLRALKDINAETEVIMLTAYETLETARQALRLGARDYIGKPFDVETLRRAVANALVHRKISLKIADAEQELDRISSELEETTTRADMAATINAVYAGVLHDINNPLTITNCFLDLMLERVAKTTVVQEPELQEIREQLATVSRQIKICSEISSRHLDFLQRPNLSTNSSKSCSVNLILSDLRQLIKVHPIIRSGDIEVNLLEPDTTVQVSEAELTQMLLNLMINALQGAGEVEGIQVNAHTVNESLDIPSMKREPGTAFLHADVFPNKPPFVAITVADRSGGIPTDIVEEIFEPYFTTKSKEKGSGLGLSMVSSLLKTREGGLHLKTVPGSGSSFTLYLPVAP